MDGHQQRTEVIPMCQPAYAGDMKKDPYVNQSA